MGKHLITVPVAPEALIMEKKQIFFVWMKLTEDIEYDEWLIY